jgi:hypothetical protein
LVLRNASHPACGVLATEGDAKEKVTPTTLEVLTPSKELEDKTYLKGFTSSENSNRTFCGRCGTHFTFYWTGGDDDEAENWGPYCGIAMGTLERESIEMEGMRPARHS